MKILVTGAAGFIGMHVAEALLARGDDVVGVDNLSDYYSPRLKADRLQRLERLQGFRFQRLDIADRDAVGDVFRDGSFDRVVHLAAQAGVRHSITHPHAYAESNLTGFLNILEGCRNHPVDHLVYASSSSVYGGNTKMPFSETDPVDHPVSLYAATKKANELMAHAYSHLYGTPMTGLRFFTVYGPWGRPDMAYYKFAEAIQAGRAIDVYNHGDMERDFTYIDDIVSSLVRVLDRPPRPGEGPGAPCRVLNIGNHDPVPLRALIACIESELGKTAEMRLLPMQDGDVRATYADVSALRELTGDAPSTSLQAGVHAFVEWYKDYHAC